MVTTELTGNKTPVYEQEIADFLSSETFDENGNTMVVGVENELKEVYRVIRVAGFGDFIDIVGFLWDIGLTDILEDSLNAVDGYDARFRFEQAIH